MGAVAVGGVVGGASGVNCVDGGAKWCTVRVVWCGADKLCA